MISRINETTIIQTGQRRNSAELNEEPLEALGRLIQRPSGLPDLVASIKHFETQPTQPLQWSP